MHLDRNPKFLRDYYCVTSPNITLNVQSNCFLSKRLKVFSLFVYANCLLVSRRANAHVFAPEVQGEIWILSRDLKSDSNKVVYNVDLKVISDLLDKIDAFRLVTLNLTLLLLFWVASCVKVCQPLIPLQTYRQLGSHLCEEMSLCEERITLTSG